MAKEKKAVKNASGGAAGASSKVASDFEAMLSKSRERQRAQTLAQKLLGKDSRRKSAGAALSGPGGGSLASRAGVTKKRASTGALDGGGAAANGLAARIAAPGTKRAKKIAAAIQRAGESDVVARQVNVVSGPGSGAPAGAPKGPKGQRGVNNISNGSKNGSAFPIPPSAGGTGISIRGLAGPYVVGAENFAPGTTAADIESAVTPIGGLVQSCRIVRTRPIVAAEITFESREGAERVVGWFNGKTADSRVLNFYAKVGAPAAASNNNSNAESAGFAQARPRQPAAHVIDGSHGFDDPMEMDNTNTSNDRRNGGGRNRGRGGRGGNTNGTANGQSDRGERSGDGSSGGGGLYSDRMVPQQQQPASNSSMQRRGRGGGGWSRGRSGGGGGGGN